jgi:hypothetical protein
MIDDEAAVVLVSLVISVCALTLSLLAFYIAVTSRYRNGERKE